MSDERIRAWSQEMHAVHQRLRAALDLARETVEDAAAPDPWARTYCSTAGASARR